MLSKRAAAFLLVGALGFTACEQSLGPEGNASLEDREEIISLLEESGFFADDFGIDGAYDGAPSAAPALAAAEMADYTGKIPRTDAPYHMVAIQGGEFLMGSPASEA